MFFKIKSNIIFRNHNSFGYITDNRNFGYTSKNHNERHVGDKILSESGAVFFSALDRKPKSIDEIVLKISKQFSNSKILTIKNDAIEFYRTLEHDGFVVSGKTLHECENNDIKFSYKVFEPEILYNANASANSYKSTQDFFEEHFKNRPQLTNLHIEITSKCNERCLHCYIPHENKTSEMDNELFHNIIRQCANMKLLHLTLSGGEPMLHKSFCDFLKKCREHNFSINILSNLTLLNDKIVREMKKNPLLGVQASLYSMNPSIHDEITQKKGSFEQTKKAILKLVENDIILQISCPVMKQNKNCYQDVITWAKKHNIHAGDDYVIIARYNHTIQNTNCRLSIAEVKKMVIDKIASNSKYFEQIEKETKENKTRTPDDFVCSVCSSSICISDNGNVYPCAGWQDYIIGNVKETSLNDIWNHSEDIKYLRSLKRRNFPKCVHCVDKDFCTMCMVRNANENPDGDPLIVNEYFCNIARLNKEIFYELKNKHTCSS
ncbi:radical SAM/SPASM domain-containing protein [Desulfovibrio aminophilus]|uniref:radical SAM/SPASM domain-containing protein n=1 Tax=Desulfovibrio aminophilus TaxID=81425 RepID=UPI000403522B|nr:radical SAM protein [Desulfovibrio aminophilus]